MRATPSRESARLLVGLAITLGVSAIVISGLIVVAQPKASSAGRTTEAASSQPRIRAVVRSDAQPVPSVANSSPPGAAPSASPERVQTLETYRGRVASANSQIANEMSRLTELLIATDFTDEQWVSDAKQTLAGLGDAARTAQEIVPPADYRAAHAAWVKGLKSCDWVAVNMAAGIDDADSERILASSRRLEQASAEFKTASGLLAR